MSSWNPGSSSDPDTGQLLFLLMIALVMAPFVLPGLLTGAERWLLEHHVLVPSAQALFTLPGSHAGLDTRRLVILVLALIAATAIGGSIRRRASHAR